MAKTSRINLNITSAVDDKKKFKDFRTEIAGDADDSNMVIIDKEVGALQDDVETINQQLVRHVMYSPTQPQPESQEEGDVWNEELP